MDGHEKPSLVGEKMGENGFRAELKIDSLILGQPSSLRPLFNLLGYAEFKRTQSLLLRALSFEKRDGGR